MTTPFVARWLTAALLVAWPLQALDDAARGWVLAHRTPALESAMRVVSGKSRAVLIGGAALAALSGPIVTLWGRARARGCTELVSDARLDNTAGQAAHLACGFAEAERVVFFRRRVG